LQFPITKSTISLPQGQFDLYVPDAFAVKAYVKISPEGQSFPYWAKLWPAAIALAAFLQKNPNWVAGKRVAELAAGLGLPSLVAAKHAKQVWCSDISEEAMQVAEKSAILNGAKNITFEACSWSQLPVDFQADIVLLSDINYEPFVFNELEQVLKGLLQKGYTLLLATPQRLLAKPFLQRLSGYITNHYEEPVKTQVENTYVSIFVLKAPKG
jgi:predicted nicotinamide N-methyase